MFKNISLPISIGVSSLSLVFCSTATFAQTEALDQQKVNISTAVEQLSLTFPTDSTDLGSIYSTLTTHVNNTPDVFGAAFAFNPDITVNAPFVFRGINGLEQIDIADNLGSGYTDGVYYAESVAQGQALWSSPYFDIGGSGEDIILTTYSKPLYNEPNAGLSGVLTSDLLLTVINSTELATQRGEVETALEALAPSFPTNPNDLGAIYSTLTTHVNNTPDVFGAAFAFNPDITVNAPFVFRGINGLEQIDIADNLGSGYTDGVYYAESVAQGQALWSSPYFDIGGSGESVLLTTYSIPIFDPNDSSLTGVLTSDILLAQFDDPQPTATPEPHSIIALLGLCFIGVGSTLKDKLISFNFMKKNI